MTPQDELRCLIKKAQIDIGKHHYTDRLRKEIRESCNVDIEDLINPILAWHKKEVERAVPSVEGLAKSLNSIFEFLKVCPEWIPSSYFNRCSIEFSVKNKNISAPFTDKIKLKNGTEFINYLAQALHRMMKEKVQ